MWHDLSRCNCITQYSKWNCKQEISQKCFQYLIRTVHSLRSKRKGDPLKAQLRETSRTDCHKDGHKTRQHSDCRNENPSPCSSKFVVIRSRRSFLVRVSFDPRVQSRVVKTLHSFVSFQETIASSLKNIFLRIVFATTTHGSAQRGSDTTLACRVFVSFFCQYECVIR